MQICTKCNKNKSLNCFYFRNNTKKYRRDCIECHSIRTKIYRENNKEKIKKLKKDYREKNLDKILENRLVYYKNNKQKWIDYRENNKEKINYNYRQCKKRNPEIFKIRNKINRRRRREKDPLYRVVCALRTRVIDAIKNNRKSSKTLDLLGCSIQYYKIFLENKFQDGMNWENYGRKGWHIDHIIPCSSFDLSDPEEQRKCFHYTNTQSLWEIDNIIKSNKLEI